MLKLKKVEGLLFVLTILFLPTQLGRHFWPDFSFVYSLKIDYLSPTLYFWDLLVVCLAAVWILGRPKVNKPALNLFLLFMLAQAVSLIGAGNSGAGLVRLEQYLVAGLFGVYIASEKWEVISAKLYLPLSLAIFGESVLAILQFIKGGTVGFWILGERTFTISTPAIAKFDFYGREFLRPYATFPHPNVLAAFLLVSLLLTQARIKVINIITVIAITLTVSRTAMVAGFVAGLLLLTKKWKIMLVFLILILSPFLYTRFASVFNYDQLTFLRREELNEVASKIFLSFPIFGVGLNNFIPYVSEQVVAGPSRFLQPVHNIFLLALSETGILGLLGLLGLMGYPIFKLYSYRLPLTSLLPWAVIIFLGLFDHYFLTLPQGYRLIFLIWGLSLSYSNHPSKPPLVPPHQSQFQAKS